MMKTAILASRTALAALLLVVLGGAGAAAGAPIDEVERVLAAQLDEAGIAGGAVAVVADGRVDAVGAGSAGRGRDVAADTPFVIGSASKSFTALAVMQLVDAGRVDLGAPVRAYVPELRLADGQPVDDITVRDLLQQTSGLDDLAGGPLLASVSDGSALSAVAELADTDLAGEPGDSWLYANANYVLAGLVVERASGLELGEYVQQEIFAPLGMADSSASPETPDGDELAEGHRFWFGVPVATEPMRRSATMAAGYLVSTAADLGRYLSMYLDEGLGPDGARLVSAAGVRTLLDSGPDAVLGSWAEGQESSYAMGWFVGGPWGEDAVFHPGNTPDSTTLISVFPEREMAVAVVVNAGNELPVPGNPFIADRVSRNVVHAALGQPTTDLPSMWGFYAVFDLVVLLLLVPAAWGPLRATRRLVSRSPSPHPLRSWAGVLLRALGAGLLLLLATAIGGWGVLWTWVPDVALTLTVLVVLLAAAAVLRATWLLRSRRAPVPPVLSEPGSEPHHVSA